MRGGLRWPALALVVLLASPTVAPAGSVPTDVATAEVVTDGGSATASDGDLVRALAEAESPAAAAPIRRDLERRRAHSGSAAADLLTARAAMARLGGDTGTALDLLDAAIVIAPDWAMGRRLRGLLHLERSATGPAAIDFGEAIRRDPTDVPALLAAASLHERRGEKARALDLLRRALALDPQAPGLAAAIDRLALAVEGHPL